MGKLWDFERYADAPALIGDTGVTVSYRDLSALAAELNTIVGQAGIRPLIMCLCRNTLGMISGCAALLNLGVPVLPVSSELPEDLRRNLMNTYRPGFLLIPGDLRAAFSAMRAVYEIRDCVLLRTNYAEYFPVHPELGLLITTSGSTGSAKLVRQSWDNLCFNAAALASFFQMKPGDRAITCLPLQYTYGLSVLQAGLLSGAATVVTKSGVMDSEFWDLFEAEEVTCFHGVPGTYEMLHRISLFEEEFPHLRTMTVAGGKLSRELQEDYARYAEENGKRLIIMYGQSEATAIISRLPPEDAGRKPGSVGTVVPGGKISILDEQGNPVAGAHVRGELCYQGPNVAMGYAQRGEDLALGDEWGGTLRTGDLAEIDGDGYVTITGRKKRILKMAGHRISLDEVDSMIMDELNILSASVGTDDHLTVFVTDAQAGEAVGAFIRGKISAARAGFRVTVIPELPRNEGGKILYAMLQEEAEKAGWSDT